MSEECDALRAEVADLRERVERLEQARPGRKALKIQVSEENVCGIEPGGDDVECPHANVYRRQQGCLGRACVTAAREYYASYERPTPVAPRKRRK